MQLKSYLYICLSFLIISLFNSCSLFEPPSDIPAYIHIDSIGLNTIYDTVGSNSHKIKDAWVFVDNKIIGVFELPVTFPVIASGVHTIDVKPGILVDGIAADRAQYPYYRYYSENVNFVPNKITKINPVSSYYPSAKFGWREDFENSVSNSMITTSNSVDSLKLINSSEGAFEGNFSGSAHVTSYFECETANGIVLPTDGTPVYLEMNYKSSNTIRVGVIVTTTAGIGQEDTVLQINPSYSWNKIYIDLTTSVSIYPNAVSFQVFIAAVLDPGMSSSDVYFDNLKLLHQ